MNGGLFNGSLFDDGVLIAGKHRTARAVLLQIEKESSKNRTLTCSG
jgi:hypothetical protein